MSSSPIDRRAFLATGFTLAGATVLGVSATGCVAERVVAPPSSSGPALRTAAATLDGDLAEPRVIRSVGGLLSADLTCTTHPVTVGGRQALQPVTYDGEFPGPTLRVRPGDTIDITFVNRIVFDQAETKPGYGRPPRDDDRDEKPTNATNLHFHGMHVPPTDAADNMAIVVPARGTQRYQFKVPSDHPAGLYWYHAHVHGLVTNQVGRGAAGMIYVENAHTDRIAQLGIRHRLMALQQAYFDADLRTLTSDDGERANETRALSLINGQLMPEIHMRPGEPQVWSLLNGSTSAFYLLRLEGHTFDVIAEDGVPLRTPRVQQTALLMASGQRTEVVVRASATAGSYALAYDAHDQGVDTWPARELGTVVVAGPAWTGASHPGVDPFVSLEDLSLVQPVCQRSILFGINEAVEEGEFGRFTMNGHAWDPNISEWTSTLGTVEEWVITNATQQDHPFHVHVNPFQITQRNGAPVPFDGYHDTAIVRRFESLTVRTRFRDFPGELVLMHCHILDHEDMGMMTRFAIVKA